MSASDAAVLLAAIEAAQDPLSGPPPQWPESPAYQADFVRTSLGRAFPETDISLDCQEFPCIGVIETGTDVPAELAADLQAHGFPRNAYGLVVDYAESAGLEDLSLAVHQAALDDGGYRILVTWLTKDRDAELGSRVQSRFDWLAEHGLDALEHAE